MARFLKKKDASIGQSPGAPIFIGERKVDDVNVRIIDYDRESLIAEVARTLITVK